MSTEHQQDSFGNRAGRPAEGHRQETNHHPGRTYFLGIAIDNYRHWPKLRNARRDMRAVSRLLCDVYGFSEKDMIFLEDEGATTEKIINTLHSLVRVVGKTDSLIIYYAGHGHFENDTQRGYWVPVNARNREIADYIQNSVIKDYLKDIPSLHTLLLSDSCFSGSLFVRGYQRDGLLTAKELLQLQSRWALCSGRHNETVADGPPNGHSPFAESILDVLGKSDREYITLDFLLEQVRNQTRANYSQLPDGGPLQFADHRRGQFVFMRQTARKPADEEAWEKIELMPEQTLVQVNDKINSIESFCKIHPQSSHYSEAISLGIKLEERRDYLKVGNSSSPFALRQFLVQHPYSIYAAEIRKRLEAIEGKQTPRDNHEQSGTTSASVPIWEKWGKQIAAIVAACLLILLIGYVASNLITPGPDKSASTAAEKNEQLPADNKDNSTASVDNQSGQQTAAQNPTATPTEGNGGTQQTPETKKSPREEVSKSDSRSPDRTRDDTPVPRQDNPVRTPVQPDPAPTTTDLSSLTSTLVLVQGGSFDMGCTSEQQNCYSDEKPVHRVTLNSYYIGQYEVTQAQWRAVMGNNPSKFSGCNQCPVEQVSWNEIQDFLRRLNARTGQNYRLPTEAEWEFAARGGNNSRGYQYAGSGSLGSVGWFNDNSGNKTHPVGQKSPNELGLYDMSGNVWEWCQDWYGDYSSSAQTNPKGPSTGSYRVDRGGSWGYVPQRCRVALRGLGGPGLRRYVVGFRLARTP